jgi:Ca-activated chloride channel family protein
MIGTPLSVLAEEQINQIPSSGVGTEPGFGALRTERGCLPLAALDVRARIDGLVAQTEVRQTFVNGHNEPLEATYIFPLPDRAAVMRFRLEVAGRVVEGELQERGQARRTYTQAVKAGHRAAIAEEERPGVFTLRVGNLPPREQAIITLTLIGPLPFSVSADSSGCCSGEVTFRFPLVVAPRYIPGSPLPGANVGAGVGGDTDAVPDASRISPPVLLPGFANPVRLSLAVELSSALDPFDLRSSLHTVTEEEGPLWRILRLRVGERLDRDFVLRYRVGGSQVRTSLAMQPDAAGRSGTFLLTLVPPVSLPSQRVGRDVVFVLDRSGSMDGWKMVAARRAVARMVETLTTEDRFTVYAFDDNIETPTGFDGVALVPATDGHRFRASEFLGGVGARGGTEMARPLGQALAEMKRGRREDRSRVLVLITDGQVGNEDQILRTLGEEARGVRIFTLGIDRAVNETFLRRLAEMGGGSSEVVESEERLDEVMDQVHRHIGAPVLAGLRLEAQGLQIEEDSLVPGRLPNLFAGSPVMISGRYQGVAVGAVVVRGLSPQGKEWATEVAGGSRGVEVARVWARGRVRELEDRYVVGRGDPRTLEKEIVGTSLRFGVLCRFTAFVAVDRSAVVNPGGQGKQVVQPVETPSGWDEEEKDRHMPSAAYGLAARASVRAGARNAPAPAGPAPQAAKKIANIPPELLEASRGTGPNNDNRDEGTTTTDYDAAEDFDDDDLDDVDFDDDDFDGESEQKRDREIRERRRDIRTPRRAQEAQEGVAKRISGHPVVPPRKLRRIGEDRATHLLRRIGEEAGQTASARWTCLLSLLDELAAWVNDLNAAEDRSPTLTRLAEVVQKMQAARTNPPGEGAIHAWWDEVRKGLAEWLTAPGGTREGFWK